MSRWSGTSRRLLFAFGSLVVFMGTASYFAMAGLWEIHDALHAVKRQEEGVRGALELASAVRDQYAHQAHTIIIGDDSHLGMYGKAQGRVLELTRRARERATGIEERAWIDDIERSSRELDATFRSRILPAVLSRQTAMVESGHARAQELVTSIQERADRLAQRSEDSIGDFKEHADAIEHVAYRWTVIFLAASIGFAVWVGFYIRRSVAGPVARLEAGAARIARGDLSTSIDIDSPDEFGRLAGEFNAMTRSLKKHQQELVESEKLAGIGRLAAGVAHEINNPLGVILGYVRVMRRKAEGGLAEDLDVIEQEAIRCQQIVEGLLDLSRPSAPLPTVVDLRELCDEVVARLRESNELGELQITIKGTGIARGHPQKLRQVVTNLVKNAAEAAGPGGSAEVTAGASEDWATLTVSDSGPGIAEEARSRLFEPFFTTKAKGTGLGLAVSQAIVHSHGGSIEVDRSLQGGASFTVWLPGAAEGGS